MCNIRLPRTCLHLYYYKCISRVLGCLVCQTPQAHLITLPGQQQTTATARAQERDSDLPCVQSLDSTSIFPSWHSVREPSDCNQSETPPVRVHGLLDAILGVVPLRDRNTSIVLDVRGRTLPRGPELIVQSTTSLRMSPVYGYREIEKC